MTNIIIKRPAGQKYCDTPTVRVLGKVGRQARLFAQNRAKTTACQRSRVDVAVHFAEITERFCKPKIDITHRPVGLGKKSDRYTVRAKEKYRGKQREPFRI